MIVIMELVGGAVLLGSCILGGLWVRDNVTIRGSSKPTSPLPHSTPETRARSGQDTGVE